MPRGDKTGPEGRGSMTGRRMGYCVGNNRSGYEEFDEYGRGVARGFGRGFGRGMGFRFGRGYRPLSEEVKPNVSDENSVLDEIRNLKKQMDALEKKLSDFNK
ncbi:MAG: DUF5320 domain-containing protein [Bacteroidota bacterium]|nr:DUF5320 domain-containing protein [Bacteroidota bacterium]